MTGMNNLSLFFAGLILIVFAGLFHVYRYGMSKASVLPPPPKAALQEQKPKAIAEQPKQISETKKLPETGGDDKKDAPKLAPQPTPQVKTGSVGQDLGKDSAVGTADLKKP